MGEGITPMIAEHILSKSHLQSLETSYLRAAETTASPVVRVQDWTLPDGCVVWFNHITGESGCESLGQTPPPSRPIPSFAQELGSAGSEAAPAVLAPQWEKQ